MQPPVIVGVGQTSYEVNTGGVSLQELIFEAATLALEDAGLKRQDVDSIVIGSQDLIDGRGISNMQNAGPAGAYLKDEIRVANDGIYALLLAAMQIAAGRSRRALVISWAKCSETDIDAVSSAEFEPFCDRPVGLSGPIALALQANTLLGRNAGARRAASKLVMSSRAAGSRNPLVRANERVSIDDIESSPLASWPLHVLDLPPPRDGACALVVAAADEGRSSKHPQVSVAGTGWGSEAYGIGARDFLEVPSLRRASARATQRAGVVASDIDVVEFAAHSSFEHLIALQNMAFFHDGDTVAAILDGDAERIGRTALNPSGGTLASNPVAAVGLIRVAEVALQLMGRAGAHQVANARIGVAHGTSGQCLQSNGVVVLRRL